MKQLNILQFLPYYPPHSGGLETHAQQWGKYWVKNRYGKVYNIISDIQQSESNHKKITFSGENIGYIQDGVENLIVPTYEIINNFPVYKIHSPQYKNILQYLDTKDIDTVITRTRFFLTSFLGGLYARKQSLSWCHIEHGSDYIHLQSRFKNFIAYIYDRLLGKWIFKKSDILIGVSHACRKFVTTQFFPKSMEVIYRGVDLPDITHNNELKNKFPDKIILGFVGRLYKWKNADSLIQAYYSLENTIRSKTQLVIVGDGEDLQRLQKLDSENKVYFTGAKSGSEAVNLQDQFDIHVHSSSSGGGLATTLLQAIGLGKYVVATPYEGAKEVIVHNKNGILLENDSVESIYLGITKAVKTLEKKQQYARENKILFKENFNWEENIIKYYDALKK